MYKKHDIYYICVYVDVHICIYIYIYILGPSKVSKKDPGPLDVVLEVQHS